MLVSHRHQFIYTKTSKTASTSVESYFEKFCMPAGEWVDTHSRNEYISSSGIIGSRRSKESRLQNTNWWNHMPASKIRNDLPDDVWSNYFKFCVVRNPYERCISAFAHMGKEYTVKENVERSEFCGKGMNSEQYRFYDFILNAIPLGRRQYLIDGEFCLDDVIRYENLHHDIKRICEILKVPYEPDRIPFFKTHHRGKSDTIDELYTEETKRLVSKKFAFELEFFDYDFPRSEN